MEKEGSRENAASHGLMARGLGTQGKAADTSIMGEMARTGARLQACNLARHSGAPPPGGCEIWETPCGD